MEEKTFQHIQARINVSLKVWLVALRSRSSSSNTWSIRGGLSSKWRKSSNSSTREQSESSSTTTKQARSCSNIFPIAGLPPAVSKNESRAVLKLRLHPSSPISPACLCLVLSRKALRPLTGSATACLSMCIPTTSGRPSD
jgi:hypothetical protein